MKLFLSLAFLLILCAGPLRAQNDSPCNQGRAEFPAVDPRHPDAVCFPELGVRGGTIPKCKGNGGEEYGNHIYALGDISGDGLADWIVTHNHCDTSNQDGRYPEELLLYRGVRGRLPMSVEGERIGPSELMSITNFLAAGDWDHDGHKDLAVRIQILDDTSFGNHGYDVATCVVFWSDSLGHFSILDTTRLSCGADGWAGPNEGVNANLDNNSDDDLIVYEWEGSGLTNGKIVSVPRLFIFHGHSGKRWGRNGIQYTADLQLWNTPPVAGRILPLDHDHDGNLDLVFYKNTTSGTGSVSVLYGRRNNFPDTTDLQIVNLKSSNGKWSLCSDVTGDGVPELLLTCGEEDMIKVFIGLRGQRLVEQYGTGADSAHPDAEKWWGKPWATIWLPRKVNGNWFGDYHELYDFGDGDLDGVNDLWAFSWPYLLCYRSGEFMDSLVDGLSRISSSNIIGSARLGDIDGSGVPTFAFSTGNSVHFLKPTRELPTTGISRALPPGTGKPSTRVIDENTAPSPRAFLIAEPNPSAGSVILRWSAVPHRAGVLVVTDAAGRELLREAVAPGSRAFTWTTAGLPTGRYFAALRVGDLNLATPIVLR